MTIVCERTLKPLEACTGDNFTLKALEPQYSSGRDYLYMKYVHVHCIHTQRTFLPTVYKSHAELGDSCFNPAEKMKLHLQSQTKGLIIDGSHLVRDESRRLCPTLCKNVLYGLKNQKHSLSDNILIAFFHWQNKSPKISQLFENGSIFDVRTSQ